MPTSLRDALKHYILASAIMRKRGEQKSDMIIHSHRNVSDHDMIYSMVYAYISDLKDQIEYGDTDSLGLTKKEFYHTYVELFSPQIRAQYTFEDLWDVICKKILKRVYVILKNSTGQITQANEKLRKYRIYIGGDLLQRGLTFPSPPEN